MAGPPKASSSFQMSCFSKILARVCRHDYVLVLSLQIDSDTLHSQSFSILLFPCLLPFPACGEWGWVLGSACIVSPHVRANVSAPLCPAVPSTSHSLRGTALSTDPLCPGSPVRSLSPWFRVTFHLPLSPEQAKQDTYKPRRRNTQKSPPHAKGPRAKGPPNVMGNTPDLRSSPASGLANSLSLHESFCFLRLNRLPWWSNG